MGRTVVDRCVDLWPLWPTQFLFSIFSIRPPEPGPARGLFLLNGVWIKRLQMLVVIVWSWVRRLMWSVSVSAGFCRVSHETHCGFPGFSSRELVCDINQTRRPPSSQLSPSAVRHLPHLEEDAGAPGEVPWEDYWNRAAITFTNTSPRRRTGLLTPPSSQTRR